MVELACFYWVRMLQSLENVLKHKPGISAAADGFEISVQYWRQFLAACSPQELEDPPTERLFFRQLKPLFVSEINYYKLLYSGFMFVPEDEACQDQYWSQELKRVATFTNRHQGFYDYYLKGRTDKDHEYFSRRHCQVEPYLIEKYETYVDQVAYDLLLSLLLAMNRYGHFISGQLMCLPETRKS